MALVAENISVVIDQKIILADVSLTFAPGKRTAILGPNGAGKSTLLRALANLQPLSSGKITLDGKDIRSIKRQALAQRMAILPQNNTAPSDITVERLADYGRFPHRSRFGRNFAADRAAVETALAQTKLIELRDREVATLSGGERQRAWLAMTLAQLNGAAEVPKILLLDEPTTYLDIAHQLEVMEIVTKAQREHGFTVIMVLHDLNHALQYADEALVVSNGGIAAYGVPADILTPTTVQKYFGVSTDFFYNERGKRILGTLPTKGVHSPRL